MITVQNLTFSYPGSEQPTLENLGFAIEKGEIFGFLGPNGAGKSTTQKILIGILKEYHGTARVNGQEMRAAKSGFYESIGVAFEFPNLYAKFTALENLQFFRKLYTGKTQAPRALLTLVGLEKDADTRVAAYSKGMKIRLNFCRSLINHPEVLFLDEPTAGLDPVNGRNIRDIIRVQKEAGKTIFITTHNMHVADSLCDRIAFIVDGRIELIDTPRNLKLQHGQRSVRVEYSENGALQKADFALDGIGGNSKFLQIIRNKKIETIHTQEATLEDIFIKTTGRSLS